MPFCDVFGVKIAATTLKTAVNTICRHLPEWSGQYITFVNVHAIAMAQENEDYLNVQREAVVSFADGYPVAKYQRKKGYKSAKRVAGPDFMTEIFKLSSQRHYRHFFYGSSPETLLKLKKHLEKSYPGIEIAGMISPPYEKKLREDYGADIERINQANADFVWIGLGAPKQECWMYQHRGKINGLMLGVGAGFEFHAGVVKRAPVWMQRCGLEWLYRLYQEPERLAARYWKTNLKFLSLIFKELLKRKKDEIGKGQMCADE